MKPMLDFTPIDLCQWSRGETFWYFSKAAPTGYSVTADVDITHMLGVLKSAGKKVFPAYIWLVTRVLCEQQEFKIALNDGRTGFYSYLTPLYAVFHNDNKTFSLMWTEFDDDFCNSMPHTCAINQISATTMEFFQKKTSFCLLTHIPFSACPG